MLTGSRDLRKLQGIGQKEKFLGVIIFISLMSLGGLPGTGGFVSKLMILIFFYRNNESIGFENAANEFLTLVLVINGFLAFIGYLWLMKYLLFDRPTDFNEIRNISQNDARIMKTVLGILTILLLFIGLFPNEIISRFYVTLP
jgi:NADH-quinone oxidoreductase subunit N